LSVCFSYFAGDGVDAQKDHKYRLERGGGLYFQVTSLDEVIEILSKRRVK